MKAEINTMRYSFTHPKGKLFVKGEEIPDEFKDTRTELGIRGDMTDAEVELLCKKALEPSPAPKKKVTKKATKKKVAKKKNSLS